MCDCDNQKLPQLSWMDGLCSQVSYVFPNWRIPFPFSVYTRTWFHFAPFGGLFSKKTITTGISDVLYASDTVELAVANMCCLWCYSKCREASTDPRSAWPQLAACSGTGSGILLGLKLVSYHTRSHEQLVFPCLPEVTVSTMHSDKVFRRVEDCKIIQRATVPNIHILSIHMYKLYKYQ